MKTILIIFSLVTQLRWEIFAYKIGVGRADCTGPPVEINFMGYGSFSQTGEGIHLRQFSRAFIIAENEERAVFVSVDAAMISYYVKRDVLTRLKQYYGNLFTEANLIISGTHTHSTPGGAMKSVLYDMSILGFIKETYNALVNGIYESIVRAQNNLMDGKVFFSQVKIDGITINRSPSAYENNPEDEKRIYSDNVDKNLMQLKFVDEANKIVGAINWFPIHPVSMNKTNRIISTDNVGFASILLEQKFNKNSLPGQGKFVGAFASSNLGDVSPNIKGAVCVKSGLPCDYLTSSCNDDTGPCVTLGPGNDMFESTKIVATKLSTVASDLLKQSGVEVIGKISSIHEFVNISSMSGVYFDPKSSQNQIQIKGCLPAMGYSFAAGTTDGPGGFSFKQGTNSGNPFWNTVRDFIYEPTAEDIECHRPKPILLNTGRMTFPYEWQPMIVGTSLLRIGNIILAPVTGEFTTMAGRRLRKMIQETVGGNVEVVIAGLSNTYTSYVTTPEEYQIQRYEGASTIFGPHTLTLYLQQYQKLLRALNNGQKLDSNLQPPNLDDKQISLASGVIFDSHPIGKPFGYVEIQPREQYTRGDSVSVKFISANPRNNLMHEKSYFTVEQLEGNGKWKIVATDANWETKFYWTRISTLLGTSEMVFIWEIPESAQAGQYRIQHFGNSLALTYTTPFQGVTNNFNVI
uniref:Neutral ceramidase n=1 Tax=Corethrella appendiculata TaxID=1370023 RepID=U5ESX4_9DIPT